MKNKKGFSLIELIVVMTIIAVITVVGLVNYGASNRKARDNRRAADLEKIRIALEMARQIGSTYPANLSDLAPNYINALPTDPKTSNNYFYSRLTNYTYTVGTSMEDASSLNAAQPAPVGCGSCNYGVVNP
jgi:general secretion pathway protein G